MSSDHPSPPGEPPTTGELPILPELLDENQVAELLSEILLVPVPVSRVRALRRTGQLPCIPTSPSGRRLFRFTRDHVKEYLDALVGSAAPAQIPAHARHATRGVAGRAPRRRTA